MKEYTAGNFEHITVLFMFLLFAIGLGVSWFNEKIGGLLFQIWHLLIWVLSFFYWSDAGMIIVLSVPILFIGVYIFHSGFKNDKGKHLEKHQIQKHLLNVLMLNYAVLYSAVAITELFQDFNKYLEIPFLLFPLLYLVFIIAFIFSWKKEQLAGIFLILWYLGVFISSFMYSEFANEGPLLAIGLTILIQGIHLAYFNKKTI